MKKQILSLFIGSMAIGLQAQQSVRTGAGDEYVLYPNGTWGKVAESVHGKKVIILSNGTWKEYDGQVTTPNNTTNPVNPVNNTTTVVSTQAATAQVSENVLTIWKDNKVAETIKMEYEYDMKSTYYYSVACAPYRYDKTTGEVKFMVSESLGKAATPAEAQTLMGNHYTQNVYKGITAKISSDGTALTLYSAGNDLRKIVFQRITDLAGNSYNYVLEGNSFKYDRTGGDVKNPAGELLGKAANEPEAKRLIAYYYVYKKQ